MSDPKIAIANKLTALNGKMKADRMSDVHLDCIGFDATNDRTAESVFGTYDRVLRTNRGISIEAASAVAQSIRAKSFVPGGFFHSLRPEEQYSLVEFARRTLRLPQVSHRLSAHAPLSPIRVREQRQVDRADHAELDAYHAAKRITNLKVELDALVKQYALAL
eukprot:scaffold247217_cov23-Tisochrysis_lutea.AAC.1